MGGEDEGRDEASASWPGQASVPQACYQHESCTHSSASRRDSQQHGVRTAEKLLREFYPHSESGQTQLRLLQSLCLLATREKANVEVALGAFIEMAQAEVRGLGKGSSGQGSRWG